MAPVLSLDGDDEDALSLGLASEITTALARFRWMFLVTSPSIVAGRRHGHAMHDSDGPWHALDLDSCPGRSVQRSRNCASVMVRLLDARMGAK